MATEVKCKVCKKVLEKHTAAQALTCLEELGYLGQDNIFLLSKFVRETTGMRVRLREARKILSIGLEDDPFIVPREGPVLFLARLCLNKKFDTSEEVEPEVFFELPEEKVEDFEDDGSY